MGFYSAAWNRETAPPPSATTLFSFESDTVGQPPAGWVAEAGGAVTTWEVTTTNPANGTNAVDHPSSGGTDRMFADPAAAEIDWSLTAGTTYRLSLFVPASAYDRFYVFCQDVDPYNAYELKYYTNGGEFSATKNVGDSTVDSASSAASLAADQLVTFEFSLVNDVFSITAFDDTMTEVDTLSLDGSADATKFTSGTVGVGTYNVGGEFDWLREV